MLVDEDRCNDLNLYLQELGKDITAEKVVEYLACPEIKEKHGISRESRFVRHVATSML